MSVAKYPLEGFEQEQIVKYCDAKKLLLYAIDNGCNKRSHTARSKAKKGGVKAGVPDLCLAMPNKDYHALYIELKRVKKSLSTVSPSQRKWNIALNNNGYYAVICYGHKESIECIDMYLSNTLPEQVVVKEHPNQMTIEDVL